VLYQVKAIIDAEAQLNDELTFSAGDIIDVLEEKDADWLIGLLSWILIYPLFTHCRTIRRNSKYPPSLLTSGLNRTRYMLRC